jgi:hypothetical protein
MAYNRSHARSLCSKDEYQLFAASLADSIDRLTPAQLRNKVQRSRRLRDKYRDLYQRQRLANRARTGTKKGGRADTNARTEAKAKLFDEALERFEARAGRLAADAERKAQRAAAAEALEAQPGERRKAGAKRAAMLGQRRSDGGKAAARAGYASESAHAAARSKLARDTRMGARKGHKSAAGKRSQARRDRRS